MGLWRRIKRALGLAPPPEPPPPPPGEDPALVPAGRRPPSLEGGAALELPEEPQDTDARGREA
jgi:hypothetical protein